MKKMPYSGMIYRKLQELYKKSPKIHPDSPKTFYHLFFIILLPFMPHFPFSPAKELGLFRELFIPSWRIAG